jgi:hypothetical protein
MAVVVVAVVVAAAAGQRACLAAAVALPHVLSSGGTWLQASKRIMPPQLVPPMMASPQRCMAGRPPTLALPKSMSFRWPSSDSSMFSGFRSLWTTCNEQPAGGVITHALMHTRTHAHSLLHDHLWALQQTDCNAATAGGYQWEQVEVLRCLPCCALPGRSTRSAATACITLL